MKTFLLFIKISLSIRVRRSETHTVAIEQEVILQEHTNCTNNEIVNDDMECEVIEGRVKINQKFSFENDFRARNLFKFSL